MKKSLKLFLSFVCVFSLLFSNLLSVEAASIVAEGSCGTNLTWELNDEGLLTIQGTGKMYDLNKFNWFPHWAKDYTPLVKDVKKATMTGGITKIGDFAFYMCTNMESVSIPETVEELGWEAFSCCNSLKSIRLPSKISRIECATFLQCTSLTEITIPDKVSVIAGGHDSYAALGAPSGAFEGCTSLKKVYMPLSVKEIQKYAFNGCTALETVYYAGSESDWNKISIAEYNEPLKNADIVFNYTAEPESVTLPSYASVLAGRTIKLSASVNPAAADQTVTWTSSDPSVITVDSSGTVTGKNIGKATITASTANGLSAECSVRVLFMDASNDKQYFYDPVYWAVDHEITVGAGGFGKFSPNAPCTREQFVTFLWRQQGKPAYKNGCSFTDVPEDAWYYEPISWAAENGITTGLNDGTNRFGVGQACTREQCVAFLHRAADTPEPAGSVEFTDSTEGRYYYNAIKWAAGKGITVGLNDGTGRFGVGQKCTRGMLVTFLYRFDQNMQ